MDLKIIYDTTEITDSIIDYYAGSQVIPYIAGKYLYIGSMIPFNAVYVKMKTANTNAATTSVDLWTGTKWASTLEVIDKTKGLTASGEIKFVPNYKIEGWAKDDTENITGLTSFDVYDLYWARISFSANMSITTEIDFIGQFFITNDSEIEGEFPIFGRSNIKTAFKSGKTDWEEQRYKATELVIEDMISKNIIDSGNQILDVSKLRYPTISMFAYLVFNSFGDDYRDRAESAMKEYQRRIKNGIFFIDKKSNATIEPDIIKNSRTGRFTR